MKRLRLYIVPVVIAFAAGIAARDVTQDWRDEAKAKEVALQVRTCTGYIVVAKDGRTTECRRLMPRFEPAWPVPGDPVRLKRKEIKRAIGGPYAQ